jgi:hypothetical protein
VVRATPAKMQTEACVNCGGALSEVECYGSECSQQTRLASPHSLHGQTWCHIRSHRLLSIQSHFSLVVIVTTIRIQLANSFQAPTTTNNHSSTLDGINTDLYFRRFFYRQDGHTRGEGAILARGESPQATSG